MKAAIVLSQDESPVYGDFKNPIPNADQYLVRVQASAISQITKARASATHYSADHEVPFIPGFDGVGTLEDGSTVYFLLPQNPYGAMAEYSVVNKDHCLLIPETLNAGEVAAMAIPGMSSWAALVLQAKIAPGQTVLINGANGISGRLAIQVAKYLGAKKIICTARRAELFNELISLGADHCIQLTEDPSPFESSLKDIFKQGVHVVLDYLWGPSALSIIQSSAKFSPPGFCTQLVQIGSIGGATIPFPASVLRSSDLKVMGSGLGSLSIAQMLNSVADLLQHPSDKNFQFNWQPLPLSEVNQVWDSTSSDLRSVLIMPVN